jgi:glycosyltransferase involved in cell wall biosynthesis
MRILFLPKYHKEGPSSRYRTYNYIKYFEEAGHLVDIKPLLFEGYVKSLYEKNGGSKFKMIKSILKRIAFLIGNKKDYDVLVIEKELITNCPYFIEKMLLKGCTYTVDYDDAISVYYKKNKVKKPFLSGKVDSLSGSAALTTVGNRWYRNEIIKGRLEFLPTVIDIDKYSIDGLVRKENSVPVIVWIGSPSTVKYLDVVANTLKKLSKSLEFKLRVIGAEVHIDGVQVECIPWSEESEFRLLFSSDIGIMPLRDTEWEKGKCGFKLIQYMASCLPTVASPAPANEEITVQGETGFIAADEDEWEKYLMVIIKDKNLRTGMGLTARKRIENNYTYQIWGGRFVKMIEEVGKGSKNVRN